MYVTTSYVGMILRGLYLVTMQGTTAIIEVLMRDGQYFQLLVIKC
jgi:hypothetical protein